MGEENTESGGEVTEKIVIGLCTHMRNGQLMEALDSLTRIRLPEDVHVEFVLVDNDANGGAKNVFDANEPHMPFPCHYCVEKNRGLAHARNRVVEEALSLGATKIAMFDDDEIVSEEWLVELHSALVKSGADGVCGTVCRLLPTRSPDLIKKLWGNSRNPPNATVPLMGTNNCLFSAKLVRADGLNIRFDHGFNFSGREDTAFSLDAQLKGAKFVAAPDAIAIEKFPPARCTFGYLMLRYFDTGVSDIKIAERYGFSKIRRTMRELVAIPLRLLSLPFVAIMGLKRPAHAVLMIAASVGWLCGLFGKSSEYYLKHGGTP